MAYDTVTLWFKHEHECAHEGEEVRVLPRTNAGAYFKETLVCIQTGTELRLTRVEK